MSENNSAPPRIHIEVREIDEVGETSNGYTVKAHSDISGRLVCRKGEEQKPDRPVNITSFDDTSIGIGGIDHEFETRSLPP